MCAPDELDTAGPPCTALQGLTPASYPAAITTGSATPDPVSLYWKGRRLQVPTPAPVPRQWPHPARMLRMPLGAWLGRASSATA